MGRRGGWDGAEMETNDKDITTDVFNMVNHFLICYEIISFISVRRVVEDRRDAQESGRE